MPKARKLVLNPRAMNACMTRLTRRMAPQRCYHGQKGDTALRESTTANLQEVGGGDVILGDRDGQVQIEHRVPPAAGHIHRLARALVGVPMRASRHGMCEHQQPRLDIVDRQGLFCKHTRWAETRILAMVRLRAGQTYSKTIQEPR